MRRSRKKPSYDPLTTASLGGVLTELGVREQDWDFVIVGDGSGSDQTRACGWSAVLVDRTGRIKRKVLCGAFSAGSVVLAELMPTVQVLLWLEEQHGTALRARLKRPPYVHVITDSQVVAKQGSRQVDRKAHAALWQLLDTLSDNRYTLVWHWMERDRTGLSILTDHLSRLSRQFMEEVRLPKGVDVDHLNPLVLSDDFQAPSLPGDEATTPRP